MKPKVGDRVEAGQLLCKLDDKNIRNQIETQEASLSAAQSSSSATINSARDNYEQFKASLENGTNATLISAENAVTNAYNAWQTAQNNYDRYLSGLQARENTTILAQETALRNARNAGYKKILVSLTELRKVVDHLETILPDETWPLPKYREMLFIY